MVKRGPKPHKPTEKNRELVKKLKSQFFINSEIANQLGISKPTLHKYYQEELTDAQEDIEARIAPSIYALAFSETTDERTRATLLMFLAKVRLGWREKSETDIKIYNAKAEDLSDEELAEIAAKGKLEKDVD